MYARRSAVIVAVIIGLAGCGGTEDQPDRAGSATMVDAPTGAPAPGTTGESTAPAAGSTGPAAPTATPSARSTGPQVIVSGAVETDREAGCLVLAGYALVVDSALWHSVLAAGEPVEVTGYVDASRSSSCQVGKPLVVTDIRPK